jgi:hypothetical protein
MLAANSSQAVLTCVYRTMITFRAFSPLALPGGLTVGLVARIDHNELDYFGAAVDRAACAHAAPRQVRANLS